MFDVRWFVVEAGKPVQLTLTNPDFMPHNIIVGAPGSINPIGTAAATMPAPSAPDARAYIPNPPAVTGGVAPGSARPVGHDQVHRAAEAGRIQLRLHVSRPLGAHVWRHAGGAEPDGFEAKPSVPKMNGAPRGSRTRRSG